MQTRITPEKLARVWGCGPELIRVGMREGKLPIGMVRRISVLVLTGMEGD